MSTVKTLPAREGINMWQRSKVLLHYRDLLYYMVVRELKGRYKSSVLGFVWSLLNPFLMMLVFTVIFTLIMPNNQIRAYPLFLLCGLLPWNYFTAGVMSGVGSVIGNANLVKKVYFPREILPISAVLAQLVNFLLSLVVIFFLMLIFRIPISLLMLWLLPVVIVMQTCFIIGVALMLSALNVYYRDTSMILDVVLMAWFFLTPIFYPIDILPETYTAFGLQLDVHRLMNIFNPMASIVNMYRDTLYLGTYTVGDFFLRTAATSVGVMILGYWLFNKMSGNFGEEL